MMLPDQQLETTYPEHLKTLQRRYDEALELAGFSSIAVGSGIGRNWFLDDHGPPYKADPHFVQWVPLLQHPGSCVLYNRGRQPVLIVYQPDDYWHESPPLPEGGWLDAFDLRVIASPGALMDHMPDHHDQLVLLGDTDQWPTMLQAAHQNPRDILNYLHYYQAIKTEYEVHCIRAATARTVTAHRAAEQAFRTGASEYEILLCFLAAGKSTESELPYHAIIATNEHAATLHYQGRQRESTQCHSLLIDAACSWNGYASDVTRSWTAKDSEFTAMIGDLDNVQQSICAAVKPGLPFADLHSQAHAMIAELLQRWDLVTLDTATLLDEKVTDVFFPHGLGHFLGLMVHDAGGSISDIHGTAIAKPDRYPNLRLTRTLEAGNVLTIEPGVYFIDTLLSGLRQSSLSDRVNWKKIERLKKFGGIRIEDNLLVSPSGSENLTRHAFDTGDREQARSPEASSPRL